MGPFLLNFLYGGSGFVLAAKETSWGHARVQSFILLYFGQFFWF